MELGLGLSKHITPKDGRKLMQVGFFVTNFEVKNRLLETSPTVSTIKLNVFKRWGWMLKDILSILYKLKKKQTTNQTQHHPPAHGICNRHLFLAWLQADVKI